MKYLINTISIVLILVNGIIAQSSPQPTPTVKKGNGDAVAIENPGYVSKKSPVQLTKFAAPPVIDGVLNDEVWKTAPVFGDFIQIQPGDNVPPTHPTEFMMAYDAK